MIFCHFLLNEVCNVEHLDVRELRDAKVSTFLLVANPSLFTGIEFHAPFLYAVIGPPASSETSDMIHPAKNKRRAADALEGPDTFVCLLDISLCATSAAADVARGRASPKFVNRDDIVIVRRTKRIPQRMRGYLSRCGAVLISTPGSEFLSHLIPRLSHRMHLKGYAPHVIYEWEVLVV